MYAPTCRIQIGPVIVVPCYVPNFNLIENEFDGASKAWAGIPPLQACKPGLRHCPKPTAPAYFTTITK